MSSTRKTLLAQAAELRAVGFPWEQVAQKVGRKIKTCQNWPIRYRAEWEELYRSVEDRRYQETCKEAHTHLINLMRDPDKKVKQKAVDSWHKYGVAAYSRATGNMVLPAPAAPDKPPHPNDKLFAELRECGDAAREQIDKRRAHEGKPPATDDEFAAEWTAETEAATKPYVWPEYDCDGDPTGPEEPDDEEDPMGLVPWTPERAERERAAMEEAQRKILERRAQVGTGNGPVVAGLFVLAAALVWQRPADVSAPARPTAEADWRDGRVARVEVPSPAFLDNGARGQVARRASFEVALFLTAPEGRPIVARGGASAASATPGLGRHPPFLVAPEGRPMLRSPLRGSGHFIWARFQGLRCAPPLATIDRPSGAAKTSATSMRASEGTGNRPRWRVGLLDDTSIRDAREPRRSDRRRTISSSTQTRVAQAVHPPTLPELLHTDAHFCRKLNLDSQTAPQSPRPYGDVGLERAPPCSLARKVCPCAQIARLPGAPRASASRPSSRGKCPPSSRRQTNRTTPIPTPRTSSVPTAFSPSARPSSKSTRSGARSPLTWPGRSTSAARSRRSGGASPSPETRPPEAGPPRRSTAAVSPAGSCSRPAGLCATSSSKVLAASAWSSSAAARSRTTSSAPISPGRPRCPTEASACRCRAVGSCGTMSFPETAGRGCTSTALG